MGIRFPCVDATKNIGDIGRLMALRYMALTPEEKVKFKLPDTVFKSIEGKDTTYWVTPELEVWFHESTDGRGVPLGTTA